MSIFDQLGKKEKVEQRQPEQRPPELRQPEQQKPAFLDSLEQQQAAAAQRISDLFRELGQVYYEGHADDHQTEYEKELSALREVYAEVARCQQQADEIAARKRCAVCGAQLVDGSLFCNFCGVKLMDLPASTVVQSQRICPKCQTVLHPDDMFCTSCGMDLRNQAPGGQ